MRILLVALLLLSSLPLLLPARADADDVYLINGRSFEGVVAEVEGEEVRILLPQGEIRLPKSRVLRVEQADSPFEEYLRRKARVESREEPAARDWMELAGWAMSRGLAGAAREAALVAAELDPRAEGLEPLLTRLGFRFHEETGEWLPVDLYMQRRGFVHYGGEWIAKEEYAALLAERHREIEQSRRERLAEEKAQLALELAIEARVQAEVAREVARTPVAAGPPPTYRYPAPLIVGGTFPVFFFTPAPPVPPAPSPDDVDGSPFTQTLRESILSRDFGGRLGSGVSSRSVTGYEGAPGRIKTRFP